MPRIAILGADGFLGSPISSAFAANGWEVIPLSRTLGKGSNREELLADLFDEATLKSALGTANPNVVLTTAWDTEHGKFWTNASNVG